VYNYLSQLKIADYTVVGAVAHEIERRFAELTQFQIQTSWED
jgi:hypothetical protein